MTDDATHLAQPRDHCQAPVRVAGAAPFLLDDRAQWLPRVYDELTSTAVHEAGHAVMAYLLRRPFSMATVVPDETSLGSVRTRPSAHFGPDTPYDLRSRKRAEDEVMISLAGAETQRLWLRWALPRQGGIDALVAASSLHDRRVSEQITLWIAGSVSIQKPMHDGLRQRVLLEVGASPDVLDLAAGYLDRDSVAVPKRCRYWLSIFTVARELACRGSVSWPQARALLDPLEPLAGVMNYE